MRNNHSQDGFTLIELMIVVLIIGILAAVAIPNYVRMQENAKRASCLSNQRQLGEQSILYVGETGLSNAVFNVNDLFTASYATGDLCECPVSTLDDFDDYMVQVVGGRVQQLVCMIRPVRHDYTLPN